MAPLSLPAIVDNLPANEYHEMTDYVSNSMLKVFIDSRQKYCAMYVDKILIAEPTDAMLFGAAVHALLLEPGAIDKVVACIPREVLNDSGHRRGKKWTSWRDDQPEGVAPLSEEEWNSLSAAVIAIQQHPLSHAFFPEPDAVEQSIFWRDSATGLKRKCRIDLRKDAFIVDVKTAGNVSPIEFSRSIGNFGYHLQGEYYKDGVIAADLAETPRFLLAVVSKQVPFICRYFSIDPKARRLARYTIDHALANLAKCYDTNDWREPGEDQVVGLDVPAWIYKISNFEDKKNGDN